MCRSGFEGLYCESLRNPCSDHYCLNGGSCVVGHESHNKSRKNYLYNPTNLISKHKNNRNRAEGVSTYAKCVCESGYEGGRCERVVDWCGRGLCAQGATCVNLANQFKCLCPQAFTGALCDVRMASCKHQAAAQSLFKLILFS